MNVKRQLDATYKAGFDEGALQILAQFKETYDANPDTTVEDIMNAVDELTLLMQPDAIWTPPGVNGE